MSRADEVCIRLDEGGKFPRYGMFRRGIHRSVGRGEACVMLAEHGLGIKASVELTENVDCGGVYALIGGIVRFLDDPTCRPCTLQDHASCSRPDTCECAKCASMIPRFGRPTGRDPHRWNAGDL